MYNEKNKLSIIAVINPLSSITDPKYKEQSTTGKKNKSFGLVLKEEIEKQTGTISVKIENVDLQSNLDLKYNLTKIQRQFLNG